jgi:protein tyrosine/serine phosphatase
MKKILSLLFSLFAIFSLLTLTSCKSNLQIKNVKISHELKFGGIYIEITIDDFNKKGYKYGDSIDISFTNGKKLENLPYYNGYYTNTGEELLVGYPGYPYIKACINNGDDLFTILELEENATATINLNKAKKYLNIQEALDIHYTDEQGDIPDEVFGNFRSVNVGKLKQNILYRSASPIDNQHKRASVVDRLITDKVNTIINLSDNNAELVEHMNKPDFASHYFETIYNNDRVIALSMNMNFKNSKGEVDTAPSLFTGFRDAIFSNKLIQGLEFMINNDGPYLVHCVEGKDRTGFVCMVIEALAGASYDEIINDYMITYNNYYGITLESEPSKYNVIKEKNIEEMLRTIINDDTVDIKTANYEEYCTSYLKNKGMSEEKINELKNKITE